MEGLEWAEREAGRPQPPPTLGVSAARTLFLSPNLRFLRAYPRLAPRRQRLLSRMLPTMIALEHADGLYADDTPKTEVGEANEWNECRRLAEELLALGRAYLSLILEEEGE